MRIGELDEPCHMLSTPGNNPETFRMSAEFKRIFDEASSSNLRRIGFMCPLCWGALRPTYDEIIVHLGIYHGVSEKDHQELVTKNTDHAVKMVFYESEDRIATTHRKGRVAAFMYAADPED